MKSNRKKRIIAAVLCMVMVLSSNISALAGEELFIDTPATVEEMSSEPAAVSDVESEMVMEEPEIVSETEEIEMFSDEAVSEPLEVTESNAPSESTMAETEIPAEVSFSDGESEETPSAEATPEEEPNPTPEQQPESESQPEAEQQPETDFGDGAGAEEQILSGATELKQEFADAEGNVIQKVTANLPVGAFAAETSAITMEVNYLDTDSANYMKSMMTERVSEGMELGSYVFFDIQFKVNGEKAEALQPITITIEGSGLNITDTKKATVFYFDPADVDVEGDKDELKEIPQRAEVLESLQAAGQGTENIEDYDLSEITFREDGTTDKVIFEGRKSTIYGCYTEEVKPAEETPEEEPGTSEEPETPGTEVTTPETPSEIEIISDEVNLRTEPNAGADNVAAVAYTGERFPLLENVQMEDALWYKIQYTYPETGETAELYVRSDFAKIVETDPELTDGEAVDMIPVDPVKTLNYSDDQVDISVSAYQENVIPENAELQVTPITADSEEYANVEQKVQEKVAEEQKEVAGFLAYDITFVDPEGNKLEPNGEVKVSMNYKPAAIPESVQEAGAENTEVSVLHLEENAAGEVQQVVDMASENQVETLNTTEANEIQTVEMTTESFSVFTITWTNKKPSQSFTITVHYVDDKGTDIPVSDTPGNISLEKNMTVYLEDYWRNAGDPTYKSSEIRVDNIGGSKITMLKAFSSDGKRYVEYKKVNETGYTSWLNSNRQEGHIYFIYKKDTSSGGTTGGGSSATGNLAHSKYVEKNEDGTYDLTLDVVGAVGTETNPAPVDIVFVLDISGSMDGANIKRAKSAVETLTNKLKTDKTVDSKWKLVTFSSTASVITQNWITATGINNTIQGFGDTECTGGTNYQDGLTTAREVLTTARQDSVKIVIFLTDGEPTYHGTNTYSGGGSVTLETDYNGALEGAKTITSNGFYAVGMGLEEEINIYEWYKSKWDNKVSFTCSGIDLLKAVANATNSTSRQAINVGKGESLDSVFSNIAGSITQYVASNVTITDQLTPEVDLIDSKGNVVTENPDNLIIKILNKDKEDVTEQEIKAGNITASYDSETKQIKLDFENTYELKDGYTYSVTAKIKPNDQAKKKYKENNYTYPNIGEEGTGKTSAGKRGIFSNKEDSAKVTWTTNSENKEGKYNRPVVQIPEDEIPVPFKKEPVNFFLNLSSSILDTDGQINYRPNEAFTTSVSGSFSEKNPEDLGIGVPINTDLRVVVPDNHDHSSMTGAYGVIGGTSSMNAKSVDEKIRELGKENGTNGNQEGTEAETYRIVNGLDQPAFPADEEIFEYIKTNWNSPYTGANKGQDITVNGNAIDKDKLTTENFAIRWYVFKDQAYTDYWHIDGILVPKSGILTITKTFPNQEVADEVMDSFEIDVTGNFLGTSDNTTIKKTLADAGNLGDTGKPAVNADGTVTYQWDLAVFGEKYTIAEAGYTTALNSKWKYQSTSWRYTDAEGYETEGSETQKEVETKRTAEDETPKTQTFALTNRYELAKVSIDLKKFGTTYDNPLDGSEFELYTGSKNGDDSVTWKNTPEDNNISVDNGETVKELDLPEGYYKLKEILAPSGYHLLENEICFKIEKRNVTLIDETGKPLEGTQTMWKLEGDTSNGFVLSILNEALYKLPSTGGNGIFGYMISGVALMMAAMFILYKMRRKGVLRS